MEHRTSLRIPDGLHQRLRRLSFESHRSQQEILLEALAEYLSRQGEGVRRDAE